MWRYPFGSGGNRVATRPPHRFVRLSSSTIRRTKSSPPSAPLDSIACCLSLRRRLVALDAVRYRTPRSSPNLDRSRICLLIQRNNLPVQVIHEHRVSDDFDGLDLPQRLKTIRQIIHTHH